MRRNKIKLTDGEPIIGVVLKPTAAYVMARKLVGAPVPAPIETQALIDTGFTGGVMMSESLIEAWKLKKRGWSEIGIPRDQETRYFALYAWDVDIGIKFPKCLYDGTNVLIETSATLVEIVNSKNSKMIIGQQILQMTTFILDGRKGYFSLTFNR